jgi:serine/threonine protein kinase
MIISTFFSNLYKKKDLGSLIQECKSSPEGEKKIEETKIKKWSTDILEGLDFLHSNNYIHLNLKPE